MTSASLSSSKQVFHSLRLPLHFNVDTADVTLIQLGQTTSDKKKNIQHARQTILDAVTPTPKGAKNRQIVVLPECWNSPYGVQYFDKYAENLGDLYSKIKAPLSEDAVPTKSTVRADKETEAAEEQQRHLEKRWTVDGAQGRIAEINESCQSETFQMMSSLAKELGVVLLGGSIPERETSTGKLYNTASVFDEQGRLISLHRKLHLFDIDIPGGMTFQESKTLTGGNRVTVFECSLGRFGLGICYDLRFPEPATIACRLGAAAIFYPGAFNTTTGPRSWELLLRSRATDNQLYVIGCSPARPRKEEIEGPEKAYPTYGFTLLADPWGQVEAGLDEKEGILKVHLKRSQIVTARDNVPISRQRRFDVYSDAALGAV
jgi:omega-amidase